MDVRHDPDLASRGKGLVAEGLDLPDGRSLDLVRIDNCVGINAVDFYHRTVLSLFIAALAQRLLLSVPRCKRIALQ